MQSGEIRPRHCRSPLYLPVKKIVASSLASHRFAVAKRWNTKAGPSNYWRRDGSDHKVACVRHFPSILNGPLGRLPPGRLAWLC